MLEFCHSSFFGGYLGGPAFEFQDYMRFTSNQMYKDETKKPKMLSSCANFSSTWHFSGFFGRFSNGGTTIQSIVLLCEDIGNYQFINKF